jgi:NTP pyrophosphatase (non-canonical NTP hydrolase)
MNNKELQNKIDEYCASQESCSECIFGDAVNLECLGATNAQDKLKRLKAINRFKKEIILGEEITYRDNILDKAIEKFGELQLVKASEECCELAQALNKYYCMKQTKGVGNFKDFFDGLKTNYLLIIEEIADVEIMIEQVKRLLAINNKDIELIKKDKIERLGENIK